MRALSIGVLSFCLLMSSCGKEMGRLPFSAEGNADAPVSLQAGEVSFWTDIDIEYEGAASLRYDIDVEQGGKIVAHAVCDPLARLNVKTRWVEVNAGGTHSRSGQGKMSCSVQVPAGSAIVRARLALSKRPATLRLSKADLVIKQ